MTYGIFIELKRRIFIKHIQEWYKAGEIKIWSQQI